MHINDIKLNALLAALGQTDGQIDDLEWVFVKAINLNDGSTATEDQINDLWYELLTFRGFTGDINDMYYDYFVSLGVPPGHINDMWIIFWEALGEYFNIPPEPYEFEMPDTSIQSYEFDGGIGTYDLQMPVSL